MTDNTTLWIFGDSWSALYPEYDPARVWTRQLAHQLSDHLGKGVQLRNASLVGSAQDWMITEYLNVIEEIKPEDYVVIILTSPARYWYFEDIPTLSNWNILDFDSVVSKERARAVELYIKHIQRPHIDSIALLGRLSIIAYETLTRNLRKPLLVKGFIQDLGPAENFEQLNIAQGVLTKIQYDEYQNKELVEKLADQGQPGYFKGADCRFNHLCLKNHDVLADKFLQGLITGTAPDLTQGFHQDLISADWYKDSDFCEQELSHRAVKMFKEKVLPLSKIASWQQRTGIDKIMNRYV
jgi:hypothetical protein